MANYQDYVGLGKNCGNVCRVLDRRLKGKRLDELNEAVLDAIGDLTTWVKPAIRTTSNPLIGALILDTWPRCGGKSKSEVNGMPPSGSFFRRAIRTKLSLGIRTLLGYSTSSMCVQSVICGILELSPPPDRVGNRH